MLLINKLFTIRLYTECIICAQQQTGSQLGLMHGSKQKINGEKQKIDEQKKSEKQSQSLWKQSDRYQWS